MRPTIMYKLLSVKNSILSYFRICFWLIFDWFARFQTAQLSTTDDPVMVFPQSREKSLQVEWLIPLPPQCPCTSSDQHHPLHWCFWDHPFRCPTPTLLSWLLILVISGSSPKQVIFRSVLKKGLTHRLQKCMTSVVIIWKSKEQLSLKKGVLFYFYWKEYVCNLLVL